jgi:hypothetical protein
MSEVPALIARFEDCTLPREQWTHQAHLTVGLWYASRLPYEDALAAVRDGIRRLNEVHGVPTTPTRGYHETITRFYVRLLCDYVGREEPRPPGGWGERVRRLLARYGDRELPLRHYTKDRLMSPEARFGWVEPDLRPLAAPSAAEPHRSGPAHALDDPIVPLGDDRAGIAGGHRN